MVFNPLGPDFAWVWDIVAMFLSFIAIMVLVQINGAIQKSGKLSSDVTRKIVHIFAAPIYIATWVLFSGGLYSRFFAMIVPLLFVVQFIAIGTGKVENEPFVRSMSRSGDPKELLGGTLYYALMMVIITIIWFYVPFSGDIANACPLAIIVFGCLAGGDGLADVVGRKYGGETKFGIGGSQRTPIGSLAMFIGSFLFSYILVIIFSLEVAAFDIVAMLVPVLVLSFIATVIEALSPKGLDNWTVSIGVIVVIVFLAILVPAWWPYPLYTLW